jgi:hypothetical protein
MMMWGEPGTFSWTRAKGETDMGCVAKIWEEDDSMLSSDYLTLKADPFSFYSSSFWAQHVHVGTLKTGPQDAAKSEWGPHDWRVLSPTAVRRDGSLAH